MSLVETKEWKFPETHLGHYWGPSIAPPVNVHPFGVEGESGGDGGDVGTQEVGE